MTLSIFRGGFDRREVPSAFMYLYALYSLLQRNLHTSNTSHPRQQGRVFSRCATYLKL